MFNEEKLKKMLESNDLAEEYFSHFKSLKFKVVAYGEPKPYARERYTRFGKNGKGRFYNKRSDYMSELHSIFAKQVDDEVKSKIADIISKSDKCPYYVKVTGDFYLGIPKSDTLTNAYLKVKNVKRPDNKRGDADNFIKLVLDVLHNIAYDDDKHVIDVEARKYYSLNPRSEITITIEYYECEGIVNEKENC